MRFSAKNRSPQAQWGAPQGPWGELSIPWGELSRSWGELSAPWGARSVSWDAPHRSRGELFAARGVPHLPRRTDHDSRGAPPGTTSRGFEAKPSPPDPVRKPQAPIPHRSASEARTRPPKTSAPAKKRATQRLPSFTPKTFSLRRAPFSETNQPTRSGRKCAQSV